MLIEISSIFIIAYLIKCVKEGSFNFHDWNRNESEENLNSDNDNYEITSIWEQNQNIEADYEYSTSSSNEEDPEIIFERINSLLNPESLTNDIEIDEQEQIISDRKPKRSSKSKEPMPIPDCYEDPY